MSKRPLSPHLQIYRLPLLALMSISHRITGAFLNIGALVLAAWLASAAAGQESYEIFQSLITSPLGMLMLFGWTASLYYHLLNGVRHLIWDTGAALDLESAYKTGWITIGLTAVMTVLTWIIALNA